MEIGKLCLDVVMVVTTLWVVRRFLGIFYEKKKEHPVMRLLWGIYFAFQMYVQLAEDEPFVLTTLISYVLIALITQTGYKGFGIKNLLVIGLFSVGWALEEMIVFFGMELLPIEGEWKALIGVVVSKILAVISVNLLGIFFRKEERGMLPLPYFFLLFFIPAGSIYMAVNQFYQSGETLESMISFGILLLFNILILDAYQKLSRNFALEKERAVYAQYIEMMEENTRQQQQMMETFRRERHDWVNQLIVLREGIEEGKSEEAIHRMDEVIQRCNSQERVVSSGNRVVDAVVNGKYMMAREQGICFKSRIYVAVDMPVAGCDLGIILGNALDNAIEATGRCTRNRKEIKISMGIKKEALVIVIENPYEHELKKDRNGNLLSTREEKSGHGYGVQSIYRTAEKYEGDVLIEDEGERFRLSVILNLNLDAA